MKVSFEGLGETVATFANSASSSVAVGDLVKITGNGQVAPCAAGNAFCGVCVSADESFAAVQLRGFMTVPYTGVDPAFGYIKFAAADRNRIKMDSTNGRDCLIIERDTAGKTLGIIY